MQPCICREAHAVKIIHTFSHVLSSLWHNVASCFHRFSHIHWYSDCQSHCGNECRRQSNSYSHTWKDEEKNVDTLEHGRQCCGLHPTARQMEDCLHTIWGLWHFTERCPSRGDPAVLGATGGRFLLRPLSSSLPVASCGVINVCSTTSCLHMLTLGCQDTRAVSVSCRDWIKRHRVALAGQTDSCPGVQHENV